jgi:hypothetical protein
MSGPRFLVKADQLNLFGGKTTVKAHVRRTPKKATPVKQHTRKRKPSKPRTFAQSYYPPKRKDRPTLWGANGPDDKTVKQCSWCGISDTPGAQRPSPGHESVTYLGLSERTHCPTCRISPTDPQAALDDILERLERTDLKAKPRRELEAARDRMEAAKRREAPTNEEWRAAHWLPDGEPTHPGWVTGAYWETTGTPSPEKGFLHLVRGPDDPARISRKERQAASSTSAVDWRAALKDTKEGWKARILKVLHEADAPGLTFNAIVLAMTGGNYTADMVHMTEATQALWGLVEARVLAHSATQVPLYFALVPEGIEPKGPAWNSVANWRFDHCGKRHYCGAKGPAVEACELCGTKVHRPEPQKPVALHWDAPWPLEPPEAQLTPQQEALDEDDRQRRLMAGVDPEPGAVHELGRVLWALDRAIEETDGYGRDWLRSLRTNTRDVWKINKRKGFATDNVNNAVQDVLGGLAANTLAAASGRGVHKKMTAAAAAAAILAHHMKGAS